MGFGPTDHNPVVTSLHHVEIHVFVDLLMGGEGAVTFHIGDAGICSQIILLNVLEKFHEVVVILSAVFLIDVIGYNGQGRQAVQARAPLMACAYIITQFPVDLHPCHQVINTGRGQGEPAHRFINERAYGHRQIPVFIHVGHLVSCRRCLNACANTRVVNYVGDTFPEHICSGFQRPNRFNVFLFCLKTHGFLLT